VTTKAVIPHGPDALEGLDSFASQCRARWA